jgi:hypothetical protein
VPGDDGQGRDLARRAVRADVQPPVDEGAEPQSGTQRDEHEVRYAGRRAPPVLADRGEVDVVGDDAPVAQHPVELIKESDLVDAWQRGAPHAPGLLMGYPRRGDDHGGRVGRAEAGVVRGLADQVRDRRGQRARGAGSVAGLGPTDGGTGEVRDRHVQLGAELHPDDEARPRVEFEEFGCRPRWP